MTDLTLKENEQWLNGYKAGYAQAQETDLAMPRKKWVGLTDEQKQKIEAEWNGSVTQLINTIEAAHNIKE